MKPKTLPLPRARAGALAANARLVIIGGRFEGDNEDVFEAMRELSGGRIAVLPTASGDPDDVGREARDSFRAYGITSEVVPLHKDNFRTAAFDPKLVAQLERFGSFYFTGGDQTVIVQALVQAGKPTPALEAIRRCWAAGGLVSGSSAGAAIMSTVMFRDAPSVINIMKGKWAEGKQIDRGLGFVGPDLFVAQRRMPLRRTSFDSSGALRNAPSVASNCSTTSLEASNFSGDSFTTSALKASTLARLKVDGVRKPS